MAYANLLAVSCINPTETFKRFRDFMCKRLGTYDYSSTGIGWTLIDSSYAISQDNISINDYFVMYSAGEDGLRDLYFQVKYVSGNINVLGYLYWNVTTHVGVQAYGLASNWTNTLATNNIFWCYGDLDAFVGIAKYGTTYHTIIGGWMPESPFDQSITVSSAAITSGASRVVTFASVPAAWAVGKNLFVYDNANIERVNISAISGNDVTFTAFVASYAAGCKFTMEVTSHVNGSANTASNSDFLIDHGGTKDSAATPEALVISNPSNGDGLTGLYPYREVYFTNSNSLIGPQKNHFATIAGFTSETTHTIGGVGYRFFSLYNARHTLIKEV